MLATILLIFVLSCLLAEVLHNLIWTVHHHLRAHLQSYSLPLPYCLCLFQKGLTHLALVILRCTTAGKEAKEELQRRGCVKGKALGFARAFRVPMRPCATGKLHEVGADNTSQGGHGYSLCPKLKTLGRATRVPTSSAFVTTVSEGVCHCNTRDSAHDALPTLTIPIRDDKHFTDPALTTLTPQASLGVAGPRVVEEDGGSMHQVHTVPLPNAGNNKPTTPAPNHC